MNVLVFGKDGQLGKAFKSLLDDLPLSKDTVTRYVGHADCDLSDEFALKNLLERFAPNLIINAAAYTAVDKAESEIALAYAVNARAPELMAIYAAKKGATILHYSTDYVLMGTKRGLILSLMHAHHWVFMERANWLGKSQSKMHSQIQP